MGLTVDVLQDLDLHDLQAAARAALQETNAIALIELLEMLWSCDVAVSYTHLTLTTKRIV